MAEATDNLFDFRLRSLKQAPLFFSRLILRHKAAPASCHGLTSVRAPAELLGALPNFSWPTARN